MSDWRTARLHELLEGGKVSYGVVQPGESSSEGIPIVRVGDLRDGRVRTSSPVRVSAEIADRHDRTRLRGGELLFSLVGTVGETAITPQSLAGWNVARAIAVLRPANIEARWLYFALRAPYVKSQVLASLNTTVQATLNLADLRQIELRIPPTPTQQAIAEVLGALDDKIANNESIRASVDLFLSEYFALFLTGRTVALKEVGRVNANTVRMKPERSIRYIDIAGLGVGDFRSGKLGAWGEAPSRARRGVAKGDTMWSTVRPNRRAHALVLRNAEDLIASTGIATLSPDKVSPAYLYEATRRPQFVEYLESVAKGSAYPAVSSNNFLDAPIAVLSAQGKLAFESTAEPLRELAAALSHEEAELAELRDALLPALMSGKLRVKDAERAVEDVL
ncbi:restriction endonuclease subunit S [Rathayibacter festucae]|uniref:restriction endonuclease subunit S n=1 Tax=Rathayibacter festucae TaxID=110937 RepID=UPI002A69CA3A|nr:restriction endonuclease subunit S [Rathayibacter festucae]MDY0912861.1 restriction endonuclease subunit S [Rathayibacter festucae]